MTTKAERTVARRLAGLLLGALAAAAAARGARAQAPPDVPCNASTLVSSKPPPASRPWTDASLSPDRRADLLLAEMTLEEKLDMATGEWCLLYGFYNAPIPRLGIPALTMTDGPAGIRIPYQRVNGGRATLLPAPISLAASWDPEVARAQGDLLGAEAFATGHNVLLGPTLDLARNPLAGRTFEGFGEDPLLASRFAVPLVQGIQQHPVLADAKHYAVYNQETDRFTIDARVDERALREVYLRPFDAAVRQGNVATVMCGFNRVNGVYACEDPALIAGVLKGDMGFQGFVMSDFGGTHSTLGSASAGLDQELASERYYGWQLFGAVSSGQVAQSVVDGMARRIVRSMFQFGLFDKPVAEGPLPEQEHGRKSRELAEQGVVLLKNDGALPLDPAGVRSIALIGADAANAATEGGGAARVEPTYAVSALDALRQRAGAGVRVEHAPGTDPVVPAHLLPGPVAVPSSVLAPPGAAPGTHGLHGEFWLNSSFGGTPDFTRTDRQVALSLGFFDYPSVNASSVAQLPQAFDLVRMSARWTGTITAPATGDYAFTLTSRGRALLFVDGRRVIDDPASHPLDSRSGTLHLGAGEVHDLRVDYSADSSEIGQKVDTGGDVKLGWQPPPGTASPSIAEAAALAARSDVAVVMVRDYGTEERDRSDLALPNDQDALVQAVAAANPRTIVVLTTGQPISMPWLGAVRAVVEAWYPGQEQGNVIARVLFGDVNPSGKLPITFPRSLDSTPTKGVVEVAAGNDGPQANYSEGLLIGYRWYDAKGSEPLFPFGFGLSYTTFGYEKLAVDDATHVSFTVRNTGGRAGAEVAQVYVSACPGDGAAPPRALAGFTKVSLAPGEAKRVSVELAQEALSTWSVDAHAFQVPSCDRSVSVGGSSRDAKLTSRLAPGAVAAAGGSSAPSGGEAPSPASGSGGGAPGCTQGGASSAAWPALAVALLAALRRRGRRT